MKTTNLPSLKDLIQDDEMTLKENALMVLLNQTPPDKWLVEHPMIRGYKYIPIERVEYLLSRIYGRWWVEVLDTKVMANSVTVTVRLFVVNPITKEVEHNDGVGAAPIQTDKGAGAMDWNHAKADGVQKAIPSAKTYAIKDAADCFGKIFGKDVSRKTQIDYTDLLKVESPKDARLRKMIEAAKSTKDLDKLVNDPALEFSVELIELYKSRYMELS